MSHASGDGRGGGGVSAPVFLLSDDPLDPRRAVLLDNDQDFFPELVDV